MSFCKLCDGKRNTDWRKNNSKRNAENSAKWRERNPEKERVIQAKKQKKRLKDDPLYRSTMNLRRRMRAALHGNNKSSSTFELLGCSGDFLKEYLESKFQEGMSWENYGLHGWHIDHIIPCCEFDMSKLEEQKKCFHYTNLQPLWAKDNLDKRFQ